MATLIALILTIFILVAGGSWIEYTKYTASLNEGIKFFRTKKELQEIYRDTPMEKYIKENVGSTYTKAMILTFIISIICIIFALTTNQELQKFFSVLSSIGPVIICYVYFVKIFAVKYHKEKYKMMMEL